MEHAQLQLIPLAQIDDHPQNPRLVYREDVIAGIAANLNGEWPQQHALQVRPVEGRFQILSGHQRKRAAEKAGITAVWCWVESLDDAVACKEQPANPKFFFVVGTEPPWEMVEVNIETGERGKVHILEPGQWQKVWDAVGLMERRRFLRRWIESV